MGTRTIGTLSSGASVVRLTFAAGIEAAYLQQTMDSIFVQYTGAVPSAVTVTRVISNGSTTVNTTTRTTTPTVENDAPIIGAVANVAVNLAAGTWAMTPNPPLSIPLVITDEETLVSSLSVTVASGNTAVIPTATVAYSAIASAWIITVPSIVPDADGTETVSLTVTATDAQGVKAIKLVQVVIEAAPKISTLPANTDVKLGGTLSLSVAAIGKAPLTYEWYQNGAKLEGFTEATLSMANVTPTAPDAIPSKSSTPWGRSKHRRSRLPWLTLRYS